jgi:hypothetical protein
MRLPLHSVATRSSSGLCSVADAPVTDGRDKPSGFRYGSRNGGHEAYRQETSDHPRPPIARAGGGNQCALAFEYDHELFFEHVAMAGRRLRSWGKPDQIDAEAGSEWLGIICRHVGKLENFWPSVDDFARPKIQLNRDWYWPRLVAEPCA